MRENEGRNGPQAGFTLIELAVGITILVGGLLGLGMAMVGSYRVERVSTERKIALAWATAQMETIRSLGYKAVQLAPNASPAGYLIPAGWGGATSDVGGQKDIDGDGDVDLFVRYYYANPNLAPYSNGGNTVVLYDPLLLGLQPQPGFNRVAEVWFRDPDGSTGVSEGDGYWVTVRVFWRGMAGDQELKISSLISP